MSNRFSQLSTTILCLLFSASSLTAQTAENPSAAKEPARVAYLDPSLPLEQRVNDLVSRMTLEEKVSQMQDVAAAIPRLGVPAYNWWNEGLHGVARSGNATVFPQAIGLAATWDTDLIHRVADVISTEARAKYNDAIQHGNTGRYFGLTFWSPNIPATASLHVTITCFLTWCSINGASKVTSSPIAGPSATFTRAMVSFLPLNKLRPSP